MGDIVPRKTLVKRGMQAAGGIGVGIALIFLPALGFWPGLIFGGIIGLVGLALSASKDDRGTGLLVAGAGHESRAAWIEGAACRPVEGMRDRAFDSRQELLGL